MHLKEYINWTKTIDDYKTAPNLADANAWGYKELKKVSVPNVKVEDAEEGTEGYWHFRNNELSTWGSQTWPELEFLDVKIQVQKPGQVCPPHLDFLGYYLENICKAKPELLELEHSTNKPAIDIWRMFIATEDYKLGQMFVINDEQWFWTKGDCIRLNNWKALHWTKNIGENDRTIIKVTGVKF